MTRPLADHADPVSRAMTAATLAETAATRQAVRPFRSPARAGRKDGPGPPAGTLSREDPTVDEIRFDDIERLKGKIGVTFGPWSESVEITQDMINRFAELTGDHQWIHVDVERAKRESPFGGTIAHGFLTLSLLPRLHGSASWKLTGYGNATNYGANKLRFVSPVRAGAKIHARPRLVGVEAKPKGTQITQEINVHVAGEDRPALIYEMVVLYHPPMTRG